MTNIRRRILAAALPAAMALSLLSGAAFAAPSVGGAAKGFEAQNLADIEAPTENADDANQLPLTGFFRAQLPSLEGREVYVYIPDTAVVRPYYHFIAVPNGVEPGAFLESTGWKQVSDETGECLYVLVPDQKTKIWGDAESEANYLAAARGYHGQMGSYFTTFGEFYLTGYGEGAPVLEAWAAENPNLVIAQAYVDGQSAGKAALEAGGARVFGLKSMTDGDIRGGDGDTVNERVDADGNQKIMKQMSGELKDVLNAGTDHAGFLAAADMPVPTWLVNESGDSLAYWKGVNRATAARADRTEKLLGDNAAQVFAQKEDTWATEYAGQISKVVTVNTKSDTRAYAFTKELRDNLTDYSRYDVTVPYGNALVWRVDYTDLQVKRYTEKAKVTGTVTGTGLDGKAVKGEMSIQPYTVSVTPMGRYTADTYLADLLIYVPETAPKTNIPVVVVWHGGSQTGNLFFDCTMWWQTAAKEGFAIALPTRTDHIFRTIDSISNQYDVDLFDGAYDILKADGRFDMGRIYTSGQSMGSVASIILSQKRADKLAAMFSSNASAPNPAIQGGALPSAIVIGEGNYDVRGIPGYEADTSYPEDATSAHVRSSEAAKAGADIYWDSPEAGNVVKGTANFQLWESYYLAQNGLTMDNLSKDIEYAGASKLNGGTNKDNGTLAEWATNLARYRIFRWTNEKDIPIVEYMFAMFQAHNCQPGYRAEMWDFLKHYRVAEDGTRYYSESAFAKKDEVEILADAAEKAEAALPRLSETEIPATDPSKGILQPITGYYVDDTLADTDRVGKVYIPSGTKYGAYIVFVGIPAGERTTEFLRESGWFDAADQGKFIVYALESAANSNYEAEKAYYKAAFASASSSTYYKTAASYYFVGYGEDGAFLQQYTLENPMSTAAAAFINTPDLKEDFLKTLSTIDADVNKTGTADDVPTSVWLMGDDIDTALAFYQKVNRTDGGAKREGALGSTVYTQTQNSIYTAGGNDLTTAVSGSQDDVKDPALTKAVAAFLTRYFSYGSVATGWLTGYRPTYGDGAGQVKTVSFTQEFDGASYQREYLVYDGSKGAASAPVLFICPGGGTVATVNLDTAKWWKTAEEKGIILVGLSSVPGASGAKIGSANWIYDSSRDFDYVREVVSQIKENYKNADASRFYINGQSLGCVFSQYCALELGDIFAAISITSGPLMTSMWVFDKQEGTEQDEIYSPVGLEKKYSSIPYHIFMGQYDISKPDMPAVESLRISLNLYTYLNGVAGEKATAGADNYDKQTVTEGRYTTYFWYDENKAPVVEMTYTADRGHCIIFEETGEQVDWLLHYDMVDGQHRYSPSSFARQDAVALFQAAQEVPVVEESKPAEPVQPTQTAQPAEPAQPAESAQPAQTAEPEKTAPAADASSYTVRQGDTLSTIALNFYGSYAYASALYRANADTLRASGGEVKPGMVLTLPEKLSNAARIPAAAAGEGESLYTVKNGDTLSGIARSTYRDASRYRAIYERNSDRLTNPNVIYPGQIIVLPK